MQSIPLVVNGSPVAVTTDAERPLLFVLREELGLTGAKISCGEGECGACTVLVDDRAVRSCVTPVGTVAGGAVRTIEGLAPNGQLHPLQQAFMDHGAFQCGYCTPGMIMSAHALLLRCPDPSPDAIVRALDGNLCRCGTYRRIIAAVRQAAQQLGGNTSDAGAVQ